MAKARVLSTNDVIDLYRNKKPRAKLTVRKFDKHTILIEGSASALEFLGRYLVAHALGDGLDCGVGLSPYDAGNAWFTKDSTLGIYLHKLPCWQSRKPKRRS